jgi:hypothetical protein
VTGWGTLPRRETYGALPLASSLRTRTTRATRSATRTGPAGFEHPLESAVRGSATSAAEYWATLADLFLNATYLARATGRADSGTTLGVYLPHAWIWTR